MFKCIAYDENNKRKVVKLDLYSEEEVFHYASKNNLKIVDVKKRRKLFFCDLFQQADNFFILTHKNEILFNLCA